MTASAAWVTQVAAAQRSVDTLFYAYKHKRAKQIYRIYIQILI